MLKKLFLFALIAFSCIAAQAQFSVKIVLDVVPPKHPDDAMYLMGDYDQWTPNDPNSQFVKDASGKMVMTAENVPANSYEIKVTRGSKETVECMADGKPMENRKVVINSDTTFHITVAGWADDFPKPTVNGDAATAPGTQAFAAPATVGPRSAYLNRKVVPSSAK
jgi:hypothetical protein